MTNPFLRPVSMETYSLIERCKDIYWVKTGSHSQKKSLLFTAHCVLEPLTNER